MNKEQESASQTITINPDLAKLIQTELGENVYLCYQCVKCTSGCPLAEFFDWQPNQVMRALQLGQEDIALHSKTPWLCACCQTCTTRCPQGLHITTIMEFLTRETLKRGIKPPVTAVNVFDQAFMREAHLWGRAYELGMIVELKLRLLHQRGLMEDVDLGLKMLQKHKLPFLPTPTRPPRRVKPALTQENSLAYYPGCSLHSTSKEYNIATHAVCKTLGINLYEPEGWICCGSTAAHRSDPTSAMRMPMENLSLVEQSGLDEVTMPCAACFNHHKTAIYEMRQSESHRAALNKSLGYSYQDRVQVSALGEAIHRRVGTKAVAEHTKRPLTGLRVVCYYGCLLTRPPQVTESDSPENPVYLDELMAALGAEVVDWSYKTVCCGAAHSLVMPEIVLKLSHNLIQHARQAGADVIALACPLCHTNLDARQFQMKLDEPMPVLFFTQLMAVAFGLAEKSTSLSRNLVDPRPLLANKGFLPVKDR